MCMPHIFYPHPTLSSCTGAHIHTPNRLHSVTGEQNLKKKSIQVATDTRNNQWQFTHTLVNSYAKGTALLIGIRAKIYKWQRLELSYIDNF